MSDAPREIRELTSPVVLPSAAPILDEAAGVLRKHYGSLLDALTVERVIIGVFFTGVKLSNGCAGVAYTPPESIERASTRILRGRMIDYPGRHVEELLAPGAPGAFADIVRLAALNALSVPLLEGNYYRSAAGDDLSALDDLFANKRICMVGAIIPLLRRLQSMATADVAIVDKKEGTQVEAALGRFVPVDQLPHELSRCQTAVFTGASVANGSIESLLSHVPPGADVAVVGPTAGFVPDPLFRRGVKVVATSVVTEADRALQVLAEGGGAYQLFGNCVRKVNLVRRED